jgi:hypothetical protein
LARYLNDLLVDCVVTSSEKDFNNDASRRNNRHEASNRKHDKDYDNDSLNDDDRMFIFFTFVFCSFSTSSSSDSGTSSYCSVFAMSRLFVLLIFVISIIS